MTELPRADRCETCRFREPSLILDAAGRWKPRTWNDEDYPDGLTEREYEMRDPSGKCHRFPPTVSDGYRSFPDVFLDDWCGEWRAKDAVETMNDE